MVKVPKVSVSALISEKLSWVKDNYPFDSFLCNGRLISFDDIINKTATPLSPFERSTFSFIAQWFSGTEDFLQNTSGSTGSPKPITITRGQMTASALLTQQALQLKKNETALVCLDPAYIAGKMMLVRSFVTGMKIVAVNPSINPLCEIPESIPIEFTAFVPMQLYEIVNSAEAWRLNSIKNVLVGGAALNHEALAPLSNFNAQIYATYGMTETVSHIALQAVNGPKASDVFTVLAGIRIETDARGCLVIDAPFLPEKITTNDLVEITDNIHFQWIGRADNVINTGGVKVIPEKIEGLVNKLFVKHGIKNKFLVAGIQDATLGYKVILLVEGIISETLKAVLMQQLKEILPPFEAPKVILDNVKFILTENGKINRSETVRQVGN